MSDFAEIVTVAVTSMMAVFLFVVITAFYVHLLVVRISKVAGMYFPAVVYTV